MKLKHLTALIALFAVGSLALAGVPNSDPGITPVNEANVEKDVPSVEAAAVENSDASPVPAKAGIRTEVVASETLSGGKEEVVTISLASVFVDGGRYFVLAKGAESDIDFRQVELVLGKTDGLKVEVKEGLSPQDEVIAVMIGQLRFPAFEAKPAEECGPAGCPLTGGSKSGPCSIDGSEKLLFSADKLFQADACTDFGPVPHFMDAPDHAGPGHFGPVFHGGPGFCPPY